MAAIAETKLTRSAASIWPSDLGSDRSEIGLKSPEGNDTATLSADKDVQGTGVDFSVLEKQYAAVT